MRLCSILAAVAATALVSSAASAAAITFTSGTFTNNTVLAMVGPTANVVYGVNFGGTAVTTANGYTFGIDDFSNVGHAALGGSANQLSAYPDYLSGGGSSGDANLDTVLTNGLYGDAGQTQTATLNNLTIGTTYKVLTLLADTRDAGGVIPGRTVTVTDGGAGTINQTYAYLAGSPNLGGYVLGTFTADAATQSLAQVISDLNSPQGSQFNGLLVATVPEPTILSLLGLGAVGILSRRRVNKA